MSHTQFEKKQQHWDSVPHAGTPEGNPGSATAVMAPQNGCPLVTNKTPAIATTKNVVKPLCKQRINWLKASNQFTVCLGQRR